MAFGNWRRDSARVRVRENPGFQLLTKIMQLKGGRIRKAERCLSLSEAKGSNREKWVGETAERCPAGICDGRGAREKFASANLRNFAFRSVATPRQSFFLFRLKS